MSNGQNTSNILTALTVLEQLLIDGSPVVANLVTAVKAATTEGRDLTDDELQSAVEGEQAAFDALVAARAAQS